MQTASSELYQKSEDMASCHDDASSPEPPMMRDVLLPDPSIDTLNSVLVIVSRISSMSFGRDRLAQFIINEHYLGKLIELFHRLEDLDAEEELGIMFRIAKALVLLGDSQIYSLIVDDAHFSSILGMLEYDNTVKNLPGTFRDFFEYSVRFVPVLRSVTIPLAKIIQSTYRMQYLRDVVIARYLEDMGFNQLSECIKNLHTELITKLFSTRDFVDELLEIFNSNENNESEISSSSESDGKSDASKTTPPPTAAANARRNSKTGIPADTETTPVKSASAQSGADSDTPSRSTSSTPQPAEASQSSTSSAFDPQNNRESPENSSVPENVDCSRKSAASDDDNNQHSQSPMIGPMPLSSSQISNSISSQNGKQSENQHQSASEVDSAVKSGILLRKRHAACFLRELSQLAKISREISPGEIFTALASSGLFRVFEIGIPSPDLETRQALSEFLHAVTDVDRSLVRKYCLESSLLDVLSTRVVAETDEGLLQQWCEIIKMLLESDPMIISGSSFGMGVSGGANVASAFGHDVTDWDADSAHSDFYIGGFGKNHGIDDSHQLDAFGFHGLMGGGPKVTPEYEPFLEFFFRSCTAKLLSPFLDCVNSATFDPRKVTMPRSNQNNRPKITRVPTLPLSAAGSELSESQEQISLSFAATQTAALASEKPLSSPLTSTDAGPSANAHNRCESESVSENQARIASPSLNNIATSISSPCPQSATPSCPGPSVTINVFTIAKKLVTRINFVLEIMALMIRASPVRFKRQVMPNASFPEALKRITVSNHRHITLNALKVIRSMSLLGEDIYVVERGLVWAILQALLLTEGRPNIVNSAVLDVFMVLGDRRARVIKNHMTRLRRYWSKIPYGVDVFRKFRHFTSDEEISDSDETETDIADAQSVFDVGARDSIANANADNENRGGKFMGSTVFNFGAKIDKKNSFNRAEELVVNGIPALNFFSPGQVKTNLDFEQLLNEASPEKAQNVAQSPLLLSSDVLSSNSGHSSDSNVDADVNMENEDNAGSDNAEDLDKTPVLKAYSFPNENETHGVKAEEARNDSADAEVCQSLSESSLSTTSSADTEASIRQRIADSVARLRQRVAKNSEDSDDDEICDISSKPEGVNVLPERRAVSLSPGLVDYDDDDDGAAISMRIAASRSLRKAKGASRLNLFRRASSSGPTVGKRSFIVLEKSPASRSSLEREAKSRSTRGFWKSNPQSTQNSARSSPISLSSPLTSSTPAASDFIATRRKSPRIVYRNGGADEQQNSPLNSMSMPVDAEDSKTIGLPATKVAKHTPHEQSAVQHHLRDGLSDACAVESTAIPTTIKEPIDSTDKCRTPTKKSNEESGNSSASPVNGTIPSPKRIKFGEVHDAC